MTWTLDVSTDFIDVVDFLDPVTLVPRTGESTSIAHALRRAVTLREAAASNGKYTQADVTWHLHYTELPTPPLLGDRILDATGDYWTVLDVGRETRNTRWRCVCRNLAIVAGLDTQVWIEWVAEYLADAHGAREPVWELFKVVAAKIQPDSANVTNEHDARFMRGNYTITLAEAQDITSNMRIRDRDGLVYKITSIDNQEAIDALPVVSATRSPWPFN